jgi:hypothetical protein
MIEKEDGALFSVPLQSSEEVPSTWRGFEELTGNGLAIENFFKKFGSFHFITRWVDRLDSEIFLEVLYSLI